MTDHAATVGATEKLESPYAPVKVSEAGAGIWERSFDHVTLLNHGTIPFHRSARNAAIREEQHEPA